MILSEMFDILVDKLQTTTKIPARVKLLSDEIVIECGFNYPDDIADLLFDIIFDIDKEFNGRHFSVCADHSGGTLIKSKTVNGGPKRYNRF